eukprot:SAG22_NODE_12443_length_442_cov_1.918367_1_plen_90_part_10
MIARDDKIELEVGRHTRSRGAACMRMFYRDTVAGPTRWGPEAPRPLARCAEADMPPPAARVHGALSPDLADEGAQGGLPWETDAAGSSPA